MLLLLSDILRLIDNNLLGFFFFFPSMVVKELGYMKILEVAAAPPSSNSKSMLDQKLKRVVLIYL